MGNKITDLNFANNKAIFVKRVLHETGMLVLLPFWDGSGYSATLCLCKSCLRLPAPGSGSTHLDSVVWDWCCLDSVPPGMCSSTRGTWLGSTDWGSVSSRGFTDLLWVGASLDCALSPEGGMTLLWVCAVLGWCPVGW